MYDVSILFMECVRLREQWNYICCGEFEPMGLTYENRMNMQAYDTAIDYKKVMR